MNKLKRSVIKEELVALTGDYKKALMLNQFIYWSERVKDFDEFISEEKERYIRHGKQEIAESLILNNGWIYKKAEELSEELMLDFKIKAMREHLKFLVEQGWLDERTNPNFNWDKTKQYRVNLIKIQQDLLKLGYSLEGYSMNMNFIECEAATIDESEQSNEYKKEVRTFQKGNGDFQKGNGIVEKERAIPETTIETTTESINQTEKIWSLYPNKKGKAAAMKTIPKLLKSIGYERLVMCVERYAKENKKTDIKFIQHGSTFFNSGYMDYLETVKATSPKLRFEIVEVPYNE